MRFPGKAWTQWHDTSTKILAEAALYPGWPPQTSGTRVTAAILRSVIARLGRQGIAFTSRGE